jgi:hypothetical protein
MTPSTLQALRRLLFFSRPEAALLVAASAERPRGVSDRAWRQWEAGEFAVPADVSASISRLAEWRQAALDATIKQIASAAGAPGLALVWYESIDEWASLPEREPVLWRPQQSVCAALLAEFPGRINLVVFDGPAYSAWLGRRRDSEVMRAQWAAAVDA